MALSAREIMLCTLLVVVLSVIILNQVLTESNLEKPSQQNISPSNDLNDPYRKPLPVISAGDKFQDIRINHLQVVGTHNSYHREVSLPERDIFPFLLADPQPQNYYYSHASISDQLEHQHVRSFELDLYVDAKGGLYANPLVRRLANLTDDEYYRLPLSMGRPGTKVLHIADADVGTICHTLVECLTQVRTWSRAHPQHVPLPILLEFKMTEERLENLGGAVAEIWMTEALDRVDEEIRSVFRDDELITPDDIRLRHLDRNFTLEESILHSGWPALAESRGKVFFVMDNEPTNPIQIRDPYRAGGRINLEGRVIFTNSEPGEPDAAFLKRNDPLTGNNLAQIQELVSKGYYVRTRADEPIQGVLKNDKAMRGAALASGAQIVSTDWPAVGMAARYGSDYVVMFPGERTVRCNPVNAPVKCEEDAMEML